MPRAALICRLTELGQLDPSFSGDGILFHVPAGMPGAEGKTIVIDKKDVA